jgi:hypothetical protein
MAEQKYGMVLPMALLPQPADVTSRPAEVWVRRLSLLLSVEIRAAVMDQTLTPAEAEQLLARLVLVIDQALTTAPG